MVKHIALDTNVAIGLLNNQQHIYSIIEKYDVIHLPFIVCGELLFGANNSKLSIRNLKRYIQFIQSCSILDSNILVVENYAAIRLQLKQDGKPIPENDIWIAAVCVTNEIPLYALDKHFKLVKNIKLI